MIRNNPSQIELLDIGSGRNPFLFALPEAVTINLPEDQDRGPIAGMESNPVSWANPHIAVDATSHIPLPDCTVKNIMMHHSVGYGSFGVINPDGLATFASEARRILVHNGSLYIKSAFSMFYTEEWSLYTSDFVWPLLSARFRLRDIDFIYDDNLAEYPLALRIIREAADFIGTESDDKNCCFIVATKSEE